MYLKCHEVRKNIIEEKLNVLHVRHQTTEQFQRQSDDLNVTFIKSSRTVRKCSKWILGFSDYYSREHDKWFVSADSVDQPLIFTCDNYTDTCLKAYLDILHQGNTQSPILPEFNIKLKLELMKFLKDDKKTEASEFENNLYDLILGQTVTFW